VIFLFGQRLYFGANNTCFSAPLFACDLLPGCGRPRLALRTALWFGSVIADAIIARSIYRVGPTLD